MIILSDRLVELRIENKRLKEQIQDLENKLLSIVGMITLESSGGPNKKVVINEKILELFHKTNDKLRIVTTRVDQFYANELKKLAGKGIDILLITNERSRIPSQYTKIYDDLKVTNGIKIINHPNLKYLLMFNENEAIYCGGALDKEELENSILIVTTIKESSKLRKIREIFNMMLPSFMRS